MHFLRNRNERKKYVWEWRENCIRSWTFAIIHEGVCALVQWFIVIFSHFFQSFKLMISALLFFSSCAMMKMLSEILWDVIHIIVLRMLHTMATSFKASSSCAMRMYEMCEHHDENQLKVIPKFWIFWIFFCVQLLLFLPANLNQIYLVGS